ncbi:helix-turn-helix transcriptional regulator [Nocardia sp. NPDC050697]|uniref:helix-turn-helix domain-containing protein n=1 Tax=Nocardia sp. NPDC050697 TaxID=3155158 RepID=UPI0034117C59
MSDSTVGKRIAAQRKIARFTQAQLGRIAGYSTSMVSKVEQGREAPSDGFVAAVARALDTAPERLTGGPPWAAIEEEGPLEGIGELRAILAEGTYVTGTEPPPLADLAAEMAAIELAYRNDHGRVALAQLPGTLRRLYGALHAAPVGHRAPVSTLLAAAWHTTERLCRRFGFLSLSLIALDRLDSASAEADDPLYAALARGQRARLLMYHDGNDLGLRLIEESLDMIEGSTVGANTVRGHAHLCGAVVAARGMRPDTARDHLEHARGLARPLSGESDLYGTLFGPANVGIHACAVALESGEPDRAAREGAALVLPPGIAPPRAGHHWQDVARANLLAGRPGDALTALRRAREVAPQQTRLHPSVRETYLGIVAAERRRSDSVGAFGAWLRITP